MWQARIVAVLLMLAPVTAQAELTSAEKVQMLKLAAVLGPLEDTVVHGVDSSWLNADGTMAALIGAAQALIDKNGLTTGTKAVATNVMAAHRSVHFCLLALLHANPGLAGVGSFDETAPSDQWVAGARGLCTNGTIYLSSAGTYATYWVPDGAPGKAAVQDQVSKVLQKLAAVDLSLGFLSWQPIDFPQVIGPHGDYKATLDQYAQAVNLYDSEISGLIGTPLSPVLGRTYAIGQFLRHALLKTAMIPMNPDSCKMNRFRLAADSVRYILATGLAQSNNQMIVALDREVPQDVPGHQQIFDILSYQWAHADLGVWFLMVFPNPAKLGLSTNRAIEPASWTAPLCQ